MPTFDSLLLDPPAYLDYEMSDNELVVVRYEVDQTIMTALMGLMPDKRFDFLLKDAVQEMNS